MDNFPTPPKPDGTEGTATCKMTYKEGEKILTHTVYGCIVKNDANLQGFIEGHKKQSADLEKFKNTKYFFYTCDPNFEERAYEEFKVTCRRFSKSSKPKSFALNSPPSGNIVRVGKHIFLLCDSQVFNDSNFLKNYSKEIKAGQNFNPNATAGIVVHGLSDEKECLKFIPLKLSHQSSNVYDVDAEYHEKLIHAGPVLLKDKKTVVGRFIKKEENKISISFFGNDQDVNSLMAATSIKEPKNNSIPSNGENGKPDEPDAGGGIPQSGSSETAKPKLGKTFGDLSGENQESLLVEIEAEKKQLKSSIEIPSGDERQKYEIRKLTQLLRKNKMTNTIKWMKSNLERGITGPYLDENTNVRDMPWPVRRDLTHALSANNDHWKTLADYLGFSNVELQFADNRFTNPAEEILKKWETKRDASVGNLYDILVLLDMPIIADSGI